MRGSDIALPLCSRNELTEDTTAPLTDAESVHPVLFAYCSKVKVTGAFASAAANCP